MSFQYPNTHTELFLSTVYLIRSCYYPSRHSQTYCYGISANVLSKPWQIFLNRLLPIVYLLVVSHYTFIHSFSTALLPTVNLEGSFHYPDSYPLLLCWHASFYQSPLAILRDILNWFAFNYQIWCCAFTFLSDNFHCFPANFIFASVP